MGIQKRLSGTITRDDYNNLVDYLGGPSNNPLFMSASLLDPSAITGRLIFMLSSGLLGGDSALFWDITNKRLVGQLEVNGSIKITAGSGGVIILSDGTTLATAPVAVPSQWTTVGSDIYFLNKVGIGVNPPTRPFDLIGTFSFRDSAAWVGISDSTIPLPLDDWNNSRIRMGGTFDQNTVFQPLVTIQTRTVGSAPANYVLKDALEVVMLNSQPSSGADIADMCAVDVNTHAPAGNTNVHQAGVFVGNSCEPGADGTLVGMEVALYPSTDVASALVTSANPHFGIIVDAPRDYPGTAAFVVYNSKDSGFTGTRFHKGFFGFPLSILTGATDNFIEYSDEASDYRFLVRPSGYVAIGRSDAPYPISVTAASDVLAYLLATATHNCVEILDTVSTGKQSAILLRSSGVDKWDIGKQTDDSFFMYDSANGKNFLIADPTNKYIVLDPSAFGYKVAIGTASPGYPLDVAGAVHGSSFPTSSDQRFKTNVKPIEGALQKVLQLKGVTFNWNQLYREELKRSKTETQELGLIAQDVEQVVPEVVTQFQHGNVTDYRSVDYGRLVPLLIEAIKELREEIVQLRK